MQAAPPSESDSDAPPAAVFEKNEDKEDELTEEEKYERKMKTVEDSARLASSEDEASPADIRARRMRAMNAKKESEAK